MLCVHLTDGTTLKFDLVSDGAGWKELVKDFAFQQRISAVTLQSGGVSYSFTRPLGFEGVFVDCEHLLADPQRRFKGGERLICQAGELRAVVLVHQEQRAARISLSKTGKLAYNPRMEQKHG